MKPGKSTKVNHLALREKTQIKKNKKNKKILLGFSLD